MPWISKPLLSYLPKLFRHYFLVSSRLRPPSSPENILWTFIIGQLCSSPVARCTIAPKNEDTIPRTSKALASIIHRIWLFVFNLFVYEDTAPLAELTLNVRLALSIRITDRRKLQLERSYLVDVSHHIQIRYTQVDTLSSSWISSGSNWERPHT